MGGLAPTLDVPQRSRTKCTTRIGVSKLLLPGQTAATHRCRSCTDYLSRSIPVALANPMCLGKGDPEAV
jgi:hypothetical protein